MPSGDSLLFSTYRAIARQRDEVKRNRAEHGEG